MINRFAQAGIAAALAFATIFGSVQTASADGFGPGRGWEDRGPGRGWDDRGRGPGRHDDRGWDRPRHRECAPGHAMEKARWSGLNRTHVRDVTPRRVVIGGIRHGRPDRMVFANVRGCPLMHG